MGERRGEEDAGAEVADEEEEARRDAETGELGGDEREGTGGGADEEDHEDAADVQFEVVVNSTSTGLAAELWRLAFYYEFVEL